MMCSLLILTPAPIRLSFSPCAFSSISEYRVKNKRTLPPAKKSTLY